MRNFSGEKHGNLTDDQSFYYCTRCNIIIYTIITKVKTAFPFHERAVFLCQNGFPSNIPFKRIIPSWAEGGELHDNHSI